MISLLKTDSLSKNYLYSLESDLKEDDYIKLIKELIFKEVNESTNKKESLRSIYQRLTQDEDFEADEFYNDYLNDFM